ncbi:hypothetical protein L596_002485 [Steinernema carpocapsae]|uniref:Uncharacterized protein n=1 Tax=Steinernema carpocapsae TaxID=34508 RepID=A0A4U8UTB3_STECR|nr:hypothetical protein L596_002485 [Steinernema carpocapsae]
MFVLFVSRVFYFVEVKCNLVRARYRIRPLQADFAASLHTITRCAAFLLKDFCCSSQNSVSPRYKDGLRG